MLDGLRPRSSSGPTMESGVNHVRIQAWRWAASILIYPVTILPGLNAAILLISTLCVGLDSWTWEGALNNLAFGFPAVAGITALWFSTLVPVRWIAQSRWRFLLVTTGLMTGLIMECLFLKAGMENQAIRLPGAGVSPALGLWGPPSGGLGEPGPVDLYSHSLEPAADSRAFARRSAASSGGQTGIAPGTARAIPAAGAHEVVGAIPEHGKPG